MGAAGLAFDLAEQRVDELHVEGRADLGQHEHVQARTAPGDLADVAEGPRRIEAVDAHGNRLAAPVDLVERGDRAVARVDFLFGRDRVLEVKKNHVGRARGRLGEEMRRGRRYREF